jgi:hypothetical protein
MPVLASFSRVGWYRSSLLAVLSVACSSEPDAGQPNDGASGGVSATGGTAGAFVTGGKAATSGAGGGGGTQASSGAGGSSGSVSSTAGAAGMMAMGGTRSGSSGAGGAGAAGSGGSAAGTAGVAGEASGGAPFGGGAGMAGTAGMSGLGGAAAGAGGAAGASNVASALDGLRVDDPCAGTPTIENGAVCNHVTLTAAGGFKAAKEVTIGGTPGTTYDVTLRIRGVVEPTNISGGMRPDTTTFQYMNMAFRTVPLTFGGSVQSADYAQWHIHVASPAQDAYLNDYQKTGHYIFELDYEVTLAMAANTQVTLDASDSNERQIVNYEGYALDGIPGSMNHGQFVQINVVSVVPQAD